jgi:hypothetical protein
VDVEGPCGSTTDFEKIGGIKTMSNITLSKQQREELVRALQAPTICPWIARQIADSVD